VTDYIIQIQHIGFDRTFQHLQPVDVDDVVGPAKQIGVSAGGKIYAVKSLVHAVRGVVGWSTCVWSGFDIKDPKQQLCIIKDGWIQKSRANAEKDHLATLKDIKGVPKVLWGGTVQITDASGSSRDDSTFWIRKGFTNGLQSRLHRRLVLTPFGENLSTFASLGELVAAFRDIVDGMSWSLIFLINLVILTFQ